MLRRVLATFGCGDCGRLGLGAAEELLLSQEVPHVVKGLLDTQVKQVACGGAHTAALATDGSLFTFGLNDRGQLGHSVGEEREVPVPVEVAMPEAVTAVAAGYYHTLALSDTGRVWAFGSNSVGQLGLGEEVAVAPEPRLVKALEGQQVVAIAAGMEHSLALTASGEVYSWGCGADGRLGHGRPASMKLWGSRHEPRPRLIRALEALKVAQVSAGQMHSAALTSDGRVLVWGSGRFNQLGQGNDHEHASPVEAPFLHAASAVACGGMHTLAIQGGQLLSWGANQNGCLGLGSEKNQQPRRPSLVQAPGLLAESVSAGWKHSAAVSTGGSLFTWGWGGSQGTTYSLEEGSSTGGQLGLGDENDRWAPARVEWLAGRDWVAQQFEDGTLAWRVLQVSCGLNHTAAVIEVQPEVEVA